MLFYFATVFVKSMLRCWRVDCGCEEVGVYVLCVCFMVFVLIRFTPALLCGITCYGIRKPFV